VPRPEARHALFHGLVLAGLLFLGYLFVVLAPAVGTFGYDAWAYWNVQLPHPYVVPLGGLGAFAYTPPAALVASLFSAVSWPVFAWLWLALMVGTAIWLGGRWALAVFAFPPVALELYHGNVHLLVAAAIALGYAHPWTWSVVLLTKTTSGVGLLWFAVRREWRQLGIALGVTAAFAALCTLIAPWLWSEWLHFVLQSPDGTPGGPSIPVPLWARLAVAAAVVAWGARTDRRWTVAVGATIALPVLWLAGLSVLVSMVPDLRVRAASRRHLAGNGGLPAPVPLSRAPVPSPRGSMA